MNKKISPKICLEMDFMLIIHTMYGKLNIIFNDSKNIIPMTRKYLINFISKSDVRLEYFTIYSVAQICDAIKLANKR